MGHGCLKSQIKKNVRTDNRAEELKKNKNDQRVFQYIDERGKKVPVTSYSYKHEFVNFREVCAGGIASKWLYRSSHPAAFSETDFTLAKLAEEAEIAAVINLDDNEAELALKADRVPWYHHLFEKGRIIALDMGFDYLSERFKIKLHKGFKFMLERDGPYLIHCLQGIDRTGFVVMILEMLMGADGNEIMNDYMMSFLGRQGFEKGS
ncbi:MAG: tyrosine-protein phosphatase [Treponema sp.]|jgi:protein tyrosine/serine phosphatase|nr:tyrosine-protein phosphatase [Treponema sp.]